MKIMICCSKKFYNSILPIKTKLEEIGFKIILPNCFENPQEEETIKSLSPSKHREWKANMFRQQKEKVKSADVILVLNLTHQNIVGHIGGSTFLEMYEAWNNGKKIFLYANEVPEYLKDEIEGFGAISTNGDLNRLAELCAEQTL